jgi:hypothetical protein
MAFLELFEEVADHVRRQGVKVTFTRGEQLPASAIERAVTRRVLPITPSMAEFYAEIGNGMLFKWMSEGDRAAATNHSFPELRDPTPKLLKAIMNRVEWWCDDYDFRNTMDPNLAKQTAIKMRKWVPFHDEGNGDEFCLDGAVDPAPVVFNQHDWFDGGTGENGHVLGESLLDFYTRWSKVCFQFPRSYWWPNAFNKSGGGVDWSGAEFQEPFRLPGAQ